MRVTLLLSLASMGCGISQPHDRGQTLAQAASELIASSQDPALGCVTAADGDRVVDTPTVLNRYLAPRSSAASGATAVTVDASHGAGLSVDSGDRLLVVQVQGAALDAELAVVPNTLSAGTWELVVATGPVVDGTLPIEGQGLGGGLVHDYALRPADDPAGPATWQIVRISQLGNLQLVDGGAIVPEPWDGRTGGIVAVDVAGTVTFDGGVIDASHAGFRGGRAETTNRNGAGRTGSPGRKGEGVAGSSARLYSSATGGFVELGSPSIPLPAGEGTHAAANAGGNARLSNDAAGGGGGHRGEGGIGGAGAKKDRANGGRGGAAIASIGVDRLFFGGGGGGAAGDDPIPDAAAGSGQSGGGIAWLRAAAIDVVSWGAVRANGAGGIVAPAEGAGGGGAGGTVFVVADPSEVAGLVVEARGGAGNASTTKKDGGGGGGGGGVVHLSGLSWASVDVTGGVGGAAIGRNDVHLGLDGQPGVSRLGVEVESVLACPVLRPPGGGGSDSAGDTGLLVDDEPAVEITDCTPGVDGDVTVTEPSVLNTYFSPASDTAALAVGDKALPLGTLRGAPTGIAVGDRLLVVQVQGAELDPADLALVPGSLTAGTWEIVVATGPAIEGVVPVAGNGPDGGLAHAYAQSPGDGRGESRWQAVRIPQLDDLTLQADVHPEAWDGTSGGIIALEVGGNLTFDGGAIDASAAGFRGGQGTSSFRNGAGRLGAPGHKGESVAGSSQAMYASFSDVFAVRSRAGFALPEGEGSHAPANGGGNARLTNDAAGGGGALAGAGGAGGAGAHSDRANAGHGALAVSPGELGVTRLLFGGGGGGAAGDDPIPSLAAVSGQSGGGFVLLRAESVTVASSGAIRANGAGGMASKAEGAGGGGAGGTVLIDVPEGLPAAVVVEARGGDGNDSLAKKDGGGGGGGGGAVYLTTAGGLTPAVDGGTGGTSKKKRRAVHFGLDGTAGRVDADVDVAGVVACPVADGAPDETGDTGWTIDTGWGDPVDSGSPGSVDSGWSGPGDSGIDDPFDDCPADTMTPGTLRETTSPLRVAFTPSCSEEGLHGSSAYAAPDHQVEFVAPSSGTWVFDTVGSRFDTVLSLHVSCDDRTELACNDEAFDAEGPSQVTLDMVAGESVIVNVDGFDDVHFGRFQLNIAKRRLTETRCADRRDLDADGLEDCLDPDCAGSVACIEDCVDDFDNDMDGLLDCLDPDCDGAPECIEDCTDGIDNDRNGDVDCADSQCAHAPACPEDCADRLDNDGDGDVDCRDTRCVADPRCLAAACPELEVGPLPARIVLDTVGNPDHFEPSTCSFEADASEVTARFVAPADGIYVIDTDDPATALDTVLYVLDGCGGAELACNDAISSSRLGPSRVTVELAEGQEVVIVVDGFFGESGTAVLDVAMLSVTQAICEPPHTTWSTIVAEDAPLHHFALEESGEDGFLDAVSGVEAFGTADAGLAGPRPSGFQGLEHGNRAVAFDARPDAQVTVADHRYLDLAEALTVEALVYLDRPPAADAGIVAKFEGDERAYALFVDPTGALGLALSADGISSTALIAPSALPLRQWVHVAGVYEAGAGAWLYQDAQLVAERTAALPSALHEGSSPLWLGATIDRSVAEHHLPGSVDEVALFDRALLRRELAVHLAAATQCDHELSSAITEDKPVAYWRFAEATGTTVAEARGRAFLDGQVGSGVQLGSGGPQPGFVGAPADNRAVSPRGEGLEVLDPSPHLGPVTLEGLVYLERHPGAEAAVVTRAFGDGDPSGVSLVIDGDGLSSAVALVVDRPGVEPGQRLFDPATFPLHRWVHLAGTWRPGVSLELFVDGVRTASQTVGVPGWVLEGAGSVFIGADPSLASPANPVPGRVDEVLIYDAALPPARIEAHATVLREGIAP